MLVPGGPIIPMEHVLSTSPALRQTVRLMKPMTVRKIGANTDRETLQNIRRVGLANL